MRAVWINYAALFAQFSLVSHDVSLDGKEKTQFKGLASKLSTFLLNFALMFDVPKELG